MKPDLIVDAHQHFLAPGRFEYPWLNDRLEPIAHAYGPDDLEPLLRACNVDRTVLVQAIHDLGETRWLLEIAERTTWIAGVVGWVDLASGDTGSQLAALRESPGGELLVGIRHLAHDEPDPAWLTGMDVRRGLATLAAACVPFDLLLRPRELPAAIELARAFPGLGFVVDHIAKPLVGAGWAAAGEWASGLATLAREPNVCCKLSGLVTEASWETWAVADLRPFVEHVFEAFGPERVLFGSDWPVCELAAGYDAVVGAAQALTATLSASDRNAVFGGNAVSFYGLAATTASPG